MLFSSHYLFCRHCGSVLIFDHNFFVVVIVGVVNVFLCIS